MRIPTEIPRQYLEALLATGSDAPSKETRAALLRELRGLSPASAEWLDQFLIEHLIARGEVLETARVSLDEIKALYDQLTAPPWHPAVFLRAVDSPRGRQALVVCGSARRVVNVADEVDIDSLSIGEEVLLSADLNVIVSRAGDEQRRCGQTASFVRLTPDGRVVLNSRDEEFIVEPAGGLEVDCLEAGDPIRWDAGAGVAFERVTRSEANRYRLDQLPPVDRSSYGCRPASLNRLLRALSLKLIDPAKAALYGIHGKMAILMHGPSGLGKTLMARIAAYEIEQRTGRKCHVAVVRPGQWRDVWVGSTEKNIRGCFDDLRKASQEGYALLFLDEIESVGRIRGESYGHHDDQFPAALLAEMDGFVDRGSVAVIAATNRKDLLDPALLERLTDVEIEVNRPDMRSAEGIFAVHLPESVPFHPNGTEAADTRTQAIQAAVSRLYSPNNPDNELCTLRFRDGTSRLVTARELVSGRVVEQICRAARVAACDRDVNGGSPGVRVSDVEGAFADAIERMRTTISRRNPHVYLQDLPQDVDIVAMEPVARKVARPSRYVIAA